jgi:hypothetical protein
MTILLKLSYKINIVYTYRHGMCFRMFLLTSTISDPMSHMTGKASVREADDIVQFYIALLDFFPATL